MKKLAKKSAKPTIADMTPKQFEAALARYGMELTQDGKHAEGVEVVSVYGFELTGKTRRAKLAQAIAAKEAYDESAEESNDSVIAPQTGLEIHEADYGDDRYQIADTAKAQALREAAEANTPGYAGTPSILDSVAASVAASQASIDTTARFTSAAVAEMFDGIQARIGDEAAAKMLQTAVRDCGKKTVVDGKLGPYTLKLANKIPEIDLVRALSARVQEQLSTEAK